MSEDLKRVGNTFKSKRKDLNLSIREAENSTSIRSAYLEAIEEGSIHSAISPVYAVGFMKQYALFLGIDFDAVVREFPHVFKVPHEKHDFDFGIGTLEVRGSLGGGVKWFPNLVWAVSAAIVIVLAWYLAKYLGVL